MAELWDLVWAKPHVDPDALAAAVDDAAAAASDGLDYRTRLLIRDAAAALEDYLGAERWRRWLSGRATRGQIEALLRAPFDEVGYPSLRERLMPPTTPASIEQYLRELSLHVRQPTGVVLGGSGALILSGHLSRASEALDLVDEVPEELRQQHALLDRLRLAYGLRLTHFQSHFLPTGWRERVRELPPFGKLTVGLIDVSDVFLGKLFSAREKDRDDLRVLLPSLDREALKARLHATCTAFLADDVLRGHAEANWYVLTGEALPGEASGRA